MQAIKLPTLLERGALAIWLEMSEEAQIDHETTKKAIADGIMPTAFTSLEEFHQRKLHPGFFRTMTTGASHRLLLSSIMPLFSISWICASICIL